MTHELFEYHGETKVAFGRSSRQDDSSRHTNAHVPGHRQTWIDCDLESRSFGLDLTNLTRGATVT